MNSVLLVARREVLVRLRSRAFVVGTASIIAIMVGYVGLMTFLGRQGESTAVGVTAGDLAVARQLQASYGGPIELRQVPDAARGEQLVRDGDLDALLTGVPDAVRLVFKQEPDDKLRGALEGVLRQRALDDEMTRAGLDPSEVLARTSGAHVAVSSLEPTDPLRGQRLAVAIVAGVLLYMFLLMGGNMVAQGVVEEKSSRVVELLLSTIRPAPLLAGKVLGIGAVTLLQLVVITAVGATGAAASGMLSVPSGALAGTLVGTVAWFLLGFALYATLMAAGASLVSRQEDLQSVVGPMTMLLVAPFVIGVSVLWVRLVFAVLTAFGGSGVLAYGLLWIFAPQNSGAEPPTSARERQQGLGLIILGVGLAVVVGLLGVLPTWLTGPVGVALVGAAVVWREADESQRRRWREGARSGVAGVVLGGGGRAAVVRIVSGAALVVIGAVVFLSGSGSLSDLQFALLSTLTALIGAAVLTVPWWMRLVRDLNTERAGRIRSQERAEIAAHLHDSVLQTLALIQKQAGAEREVLRLLARGYAYKEIASELFISVKTVETHVSSVLRKTQLSNRYELSRWASDRRLV